MNRNIFGDALTVTGATGEYDLVARPSGPAGVNVLPLQHILIRFDAAEPTQLCGLEVGASTSLDTLGYFIGSERAGQVLERRPTPSMRSRHIEPLRPAPRSLQSQGQEVIAELSLAAALHSHSGDESLTDLARAAASLELTTVCARLDDLGVPGVGDTRSEAVSRAAELLRNAKKEIDALVEDEPDLARRLAELCRAMGLSNRVFTRTADRIDRDLRSDGDWHEFGTGTQTADAVLGSPLPMAMHATRLAAPLDRVTAFPELHLVQPAVELMRGGRLVVRPEPERITSSSCWVRVLRSGTLSALALAPARRVGRGWVAETIVEPGLTLDDLEIDVVERPVLPESSLVRARKAVAVGREAVALMVLGEYSAAGDLWHECAHAWEELGDSERARLANTYARRPVRSRTAALAEYIAYASDL